MTRPNDRAGLPRRSALAALGVGLAATAAACSSGRGEESAAAVSGAPSASGAVIMMVRHAEKPTADQGGIDENGAADPEALTVRGWSRAGALVGLFAPLVGTPRAGLVRPTGLMSSDPGTSGSKRPLQTLGPLAAVLATPVSATIRKSDHAGAAAAMRAARGPLLVAWEHEDIPGLVQALGTVRPAPPTSWPSEVFDVVWVLTPAGDGWQFAQVPQLLLAGDTKAVIGDH